MPIFGGGGIFYGGTSNMYSEERGLPPLLGTSTSKQPRACQGPRAKATGYLQKFFLRDCCHCNNKIIGVSIKE